MKTDQLIRMALSGLTLLVALPFHHIASAQSGNLVADLRSKARPGQHHSQLDPFIGKWKIRIEYRLRPSTNPESAQGTAEFRWIMGKRFLEQVVEGKGIAGDFEGRGLIGYDNVLGHYTGVWIDTMNSGITRSTGRREDDGKTFLFKASGTDVLDAKEKTFDTILRILTNDELQYLVYQPHPETGEAVAMLKISYRRE